MCSTKWYEAREFLLLVGTLALLLAISPNPARAEVVSTECEQPSGQQAQPSPIVITPADTVRALIIFARFPDGEDVNSTNQSIPACQNCGTGWSASDVYAPAWADSLIEDTTSPTIPGSLTHWSHAMSQGKHIIRGTVHDSVFVSDSTLVYWDDTYGTADPNVPPVLAANRRLLSQVEPFANFSNIDFIFVNWHSTRTYDESDSTFHRINGGVSWLVDAGVTVQLDGKQFGQESGATISSSIANLGTPGNPNLVFVRHRWQALGLAIHEYSHDLVYLEGHVHNHYRSVSRYGVMQGNILPASLLMEGYLRYEMGWIQPVEINPGSTPFDTTITLSTSYKSNKSFAILRTQANTDGTRQYFLLEARQEDESGEYYNAAQPAANPTCCYRTTAVGSGLLVAHITENGYTSSGGIALPAGKFPLIDIETATGIFAIDGTRAPDPKVGRDSIDVEWDLGGVTGVAGDLFIPAPGMNRTSIFSPYGNPNTALYRNNGQADSSYQDVRSGITVYNLEYVAGNDSLRVRVRYDGTSAVTADTVKVNTKWQGLVQVMNDVVVNPGVMLEIEKGANVVAAARKDMRAGGAANDRVEILVKGQAKTLGTGTADADDVVLTSSRDASFVHFGGAGENTAAAADDWYGIRLDLEGCEHTSYGYAACKQPVTSIAHSEIKYGRYGISIEDFCAPKLVGVEFSTITDNRHIYLNQSDVFLPKGYFSGGVCDSAFTVSPGTWDLTDGTHVVATNSVSNDAGWAGTSNKTDLVADAVLTAEATSVGFEFRPETANNATANDWGGLTLNVESGGSSIDGATIGHAANPLFLYYPEGTTIANSTVHHFRDTGIWVSGTKGDGAFIAGCTVERGTGLADTLGDLAIYLDKADEATVFETTADLRDLSSATGGTGIRAAFTKTFCETEPQALRLLKIEECLVIGPDDPSVEGDYTGIAAYWLCGASGDREIEIIENGIYDWRNEGIDYYQSADVQATCNHVLGCDRGVDIYRDHEPTGTSLRFKYNRLEALTSLSTLFAFRTNDAVKAKLGPSNTLRGDNRLKVNVDNTKFIYENDSQAADTLDATYNYWYATSLLTTQGDIEGRLAPTGYSINISNFRTSDSGTPSCYQNVPAHPGGRALVALQHGVAGDRANQNLSGDVPTVLSLSAPYPNPVRAGVTMDLAVPVGQTGRYVLQVYDVRGRHVLESIREIASAGRYVVEWGGFESGGTRAAAGVYLLRMKGPNGFQETRKVTLFK